jgi:glycosyltransferase involved in cell wall biosynthesis
VSSPIGVNCELIERSQAGFLAATPAEWESALRALAEDSELRRRLGRQGRMFVERYANLDEHAQTIARLLTDGAIG